jgi:hypothetical protein
MDNFYVIKGYLDEKGYKYDADEEQGKIYFKMSNDDGLSTNHVFRVSKEYDSVSFLSFLPFKISEESRVNLAIATTMVNYRFANGCFDMDINTGNLVFRVVQSTRNQTINQEIVKYMMGISFNSVSEYSDMFFGLSKGFITLDSFVEKMQQ